MAILSDGASGKMASVGATSKALATTLYDGLGNPIVRDGAYLPVIQPLEVFSAITSSAPLATSGLSAVWIVQGPRRCRVRSIGVHGNQINATTAAQATVAVARAYLAGPFVSTSTPGFLTPADFRAAVKKSIKAKSPSAVLVDNSTGLILTSAIGDQVNLWTYAIPQQTVAHYEQWERFDDEGMDSALLFEPGECLTFTLNAGFSNCANVTVDWDELSIP